MKLFFAIAVILISHCIALGSAEASTNPRMLSYFDQRISQVESTLQNRDSSVANSSSGIQLTDINIDFIGQVTFGLNEVLNLTVSTEIDFVLVPDEQN